MFKLNVYKCTSSLYFRDLLEKDQVVASGLLAGECGYFSCEVLSHYWRDGLETFLQDSLKDDILRVWPKL